MKFKTPAGLSLLACTFFFLCLLRPANAEDLNQVVDKVQARYDATQSFIANFRQTSYLKIMGQSQKAHGKVSIKKPGLMKWTYSAPDPQVLISNHDLLWLYLPEEKQVTKMKIESVYSSNTPALFLAGKGKLTEAFNVGQVIPRETTYEITLFPKKSAQNLDRLVLVADKKNFQIIGSSVYDKLGNRTEMQFDHVQLNPSLTDNQFRFDPPSGVEVIDFSETQK